MQVVEEYIRTRQKLFMREDIHPRSKKIYLESPFEEIHYLEIGKGKPLILLHGGGSHSSEWINILKPLSKHFHLYVVDRPGCGLNNSFNYRGVDLRKHAVDFVRSFLDAVSLKKASILGQSLGGYFGICFALEHPERIDSLALIGAPAGMNKWIPPILRMMGTKGLNGLLMHTVGKPSIKNIKNLHKRILVADVSNISNDYLEHTYYHQCISGWASSFTTLLENVLTIKGWKNKYFIGNQLGQLNIPVKFIWGNRDAFEQPDSGLKKAAAINNYQFEVVKNAGHSPWLDQPGMCASLIVSMLKNEIKN